MALDLSEKNLLEKGLALGEPPSSSESSLEAVDRSVERKLVWKIDRHLVPVLFALL
jgi:hypothetical protein